MGGLWGAGEKRACLCHLTLRLVVPFVEKRECRRGVFYFGCVEFEGPLRHPSRDVTWAVLCESEGWGRSLGQVQTDTLAHGCQLKAGHPEGCLGNLLFYPLACQLLHGI